MAGTDLARLPLPRLLNVLYFRLVRGVSPEGRKEIDRLLRGPVPVEEVLENWGVSAEAEADQNRLMAMLGGGGPPPS